MRMNHSSNAATLLLALIVLVSSLAVLPINIGQAQGITTTFITGERINFGSSVEMSVWSGVSMKFGTNISMQIIESPMPGNGQIEPCDYFNVVWPGGYIPPVCSWWEVLDAQGNPIGEFHVDDSGPGYFHVDALWPQGVPIPIPVGLPVTVYKKIDEIIPCQYYVVHEPQEWYPLPCSWWEIIDPETHLPTGFEFHVDWTNESCEFHVDEVTPHGYVLPFPYYEVEARQKIIQIQPCDWYTVADPVGFIPAPCSWWEILDPITGAPTGLQFHVDAPPGNGTFHVDQVKPESPIQLPWGPSYTVHVRKNIPILAQCQWYKVYDVTTTPKICTWWVIDAGGLEIEFHVDDSYQNGTFHVDYMEPARLVTFPTYEFQALKKFDGLGPCDWFERYSGWLPWPCSRWTITSPTEWAGVTFHVDANDGISMFHIDEADQLPPGPTPPPWSITAELSYPPMYWKPSFPDYAPAGMPDFDERQWGTYNWTAKGGVWSHCAPAAVANSLWWLDSEFETNTNPPPAVIDNFPLVSSYAPLLWDDHASANVQPFVEHLAYLMDTDGRRTGLAHPGTSVTDIENGLAHYLSWTGVNPQGDVNGDGTVDQTDLAIVTAAQGSAPGAPFWNLAADIWPVTTGWPNFIAADNVVDAMDLGLVNINMGLTGLFYEHTVVAPTFDFIEEEVEKCEDVVLTLAYWYYDGQTWTKESDPIGHAVTVAGVNSTTFKISISDPIFDAFENGIITQGHVPIPHMHMPPEPPYTTHNDAAYVSHDTYDVMFLSPPMAPCPGGNWTLIGYPGAPQAQGWFTVIENAVVTSPLGVHDIAVTNLTTSKDGCKPMPTVPDDSFVKVNVTVFNKGIFTETFNVTLYGNLTFIDSKIVSGLTPGTQNVVDFTWNTAGWAHGDYMISAYAGPVLNDVNTTDNTFNNGVIRVVIPGNINGDNVVDILDAISLANSFLATPSSPIWNPNADFNADDIIDILDAIILANHFLETEP